MGAAHSDPANVTGSPPPSVFVTSWMTVGEAHVVLVGAGHRALPVVGHDGMIGLITIEALHGPQGGPSPDVDDSVLSVMDWHLVQLAPDADQRQVIRTYTNAAWTWLRTRRREAEPA